MRVSKSTYFLLCAARPSLHFKPSLSHLYIEFDFGHFFLHPLIQLSRKTSLGLQGKVWKMLCNTHMSWDEFIQIYLEMVHKLHNPHTLLLLLPMKNAVAKRSTQGARTGGMWDAGSHFCHHSLAFMIACMGWSFWLVSATVSTFSSSPPISFHSNSCTNLPIDVQAISIAWRAPAHTLFPPPKAIVLCKSIRSYFSSRNLSGFHSSGFSHCFLFMLHPYMFIAICTTLVIVKIARKNMVRTMERLINYLTSSRNMVSPQLGIFMRIPNRDYGSWTVLPKSLMENRI